MIRFCFLAGWLVLSMGFASAQVPADSTSATAWGGTPLLSLTAPGKPITFKGRITPNPNEAINSDCRKLLIRRGKKSYFIYSQEQDLGKLAGSRIKVRGTLSTIDDGSDLCITVDELILSRKARARLDR